MSGCHQAPQARASRRAPSIPGQNTTPMPSSSISARSFRRACHRQTHAATTRRRPHFPKTDDTDRSFLASRQERPAHLHRPRRGRRHGHQRRAIRRDWRTRPRRPPTPVHRAPHPPQPATPALRHRRGRPIIRMSARQNIQASLRHRQNRQTQVHSRQQPQRLPCLCKKSRMPSHSRQKHQVRPYPRMNRQR